MAQTMKKRNKPKPLSAIQYRSKVMGDKKWTLIPIRWYSIMSLDEVAFMAYLFNFLCMQEADGKTKEGYGICSMKRFLHVLRMPTASQTRMFSRLEQRGFIFRTMHGMPPRRWIKINFEGIEAALERHFAEKNMGVGSND